MVKQSSFCTIGTSHASVYQIVLNEVHNSSPTITRYVFAKVPSWFRAMQKRQSPIHLKSLKASHKKELEDLFGQDYIKTLAIVDAKGASEERVVYADDVIWDDDTVEDLYYKMSAACSEKHLYMWCKRRVSDELEMKSTFLRNVFKNRMFVPKSEIAQYFSFLTGTQHTFDDSPIDIESALAILLKDIHVRYIYEPLRFKYLQNDAFVYFPINPTKAPKQYVFSNAFYDTLVDTTQLIESHDPYKRVIYCATKSYLDAALGQQTASSFYIPTSMMSSVREDKNVLKKHVLQRAVDVQLINEKASQMSTSKVNASCGIAHILLKVNEAVTKNTSMLNRAQLLDMSYIFTQMQPDNVCPFVRFTSMNGVVYKLYKPALSDPDTMLQSHMRHWTKTEGSFTNRKNEHITFKVFIGKFNIVPYFATVTLYAGGNYDVKLAFSTQDDVTIEYVKKALGQVNVLITQINSLVETEEMLPSVDDRVLESVQRDTSTALVRMTVNATIRHNNNHESLDSIADEALQHGSCFSVLSNSKGKLHMLYRRTSGFASPENIAIFIQKNMVLLKEDQANKELIVKRIGMVFGIPLELALVYLNEFMSTGADSSLTRGVRWSNKNMNWVSAKITQSNNGALKVMMDGLTHPQYHQRIMTYLATILNEAPSKKTKGLAKTQLDEDISALLDNASDTDEDEDDELLDEEFKRLLALEQERGNVDEDDDDSSKPASTKSSPSKPTSPHVPKLQPAFDFPLFKFVTEYEDDGPVKAPSDKKEKRDDSKEEKTKKQKRAGETLNDLEKNDVELFHTVRGEKNYSTLCQMTHKSFPRQPVAVRPEEFASMKKKYPNAMRNWIAYGSDIEHAKRNIYFCPDVWCPKSRVAMSAQTYEKTGCPLGIDEKPILYYDAELTRGKKIFVGLMKNSGKTSFKNACFPCCYLKPPKDKGECPRPPELDDDDSNAHGVQDENSPSKLSKNDKHAMTDKQRYIMKDKTVPLPAGRYGLLAPSLSKLLGNTKDSCGNGADGAGHMTKRTNCFLRAGITYKKQSFLQCIAPLLNNEKINTASDVVKAILDNLQIEDFIVLQGGLLMKRFLSWTQHSNQNLEDQIEYNKFRTWFLAQKRYVELFNLQYIHNVLWSHSKHDGHMPHVEHVKREYVIYCAFERFLNYITDDNVVKTHDVLLHLFTQQFPWMNATGCNIAVFEVHSSGNTTLTCFPHQPAQMIHPGRPVVMLVKTGAVYEPIYHVRINGVSLDPQHRHDMHQDKNVGRVVQFFINTCKKDRTDTDIGNKVIIACKKLGYDIKYQVINYDMRAIGIVTSDDVFIPYPYNTLVDETMYGRNKVGCAFIDTMYVNLRPQVTYERMKKMFKELKAEIGLSSSKVYKIEVSSSNEALVKVQVNDEGTKYIIPLKPVQASDVVEFRDDLNVFVRSTSKDPRTDAVDLSTAIDNLHLAVRNEVVHWLLSTSDGKDVLQELEFFRHPSNPIPREIMRKLLHDKIAKALESITYKTPASIYTGKYSDKVCATNTNANECNAQCKMTVTVVNGKKSQGKCKVHVPTRMYNMVIAKVMDDLVNPFMKLKIVKINKRTIVNNDVIMFTNNDIEVGRLEKIIENATDMDVAQLGILKMKNDIDIETFLATMPEGGKEMTMPFIQSDEVTNIHSTYAKDVKGFSALVIPNASPLSLYELFTAIYNRLHLGARLTPADIREMVKHQILADFDKDEEKTKEELMKNRAFPSSIYTRDHLIAWYDGHVPNNYPGRLELKKMADIVGVDVFLISRPKEGEPDSLRCLTRGTTRSPFFIVLQQMKHIDKKYQRYDIVINQDKKYLFELSDFTKTFQIILGNKCTIYRVKKT